VKNWSCPILTILILILTYWTTFKSSYLCGIDLLRKKGNYEKPNT